MRDPRIENLAKILVGYSVEVGKGDTCLIEGPAAAEPLTTDERTELLQLRRDNRRLREERDILKKATAFFAKPSE